MITFTWDAAFEQRPVGSLPRSEIDDEIRKVTRGIRERMEVEHEWGPFSKIDDGSHKLGLTTVMSQGNLTDMGQIVDPEEGAMFLLEDGSDLKLMLYLNGDWEMVGANHHDLLTGLLRDDHPQYLKTTGGTMTGALNTDGNVISVDGSPTSVKHGIVTGKHRSEMHKGDVRSDLFTSKRLPSEKFVLTVNDVSYSVTTPRTSYLSWAYRWISLPDTPYLSCPCIVRKGTTMTAAIVYRYSGGPQLGIQYTHHREYLFDNSTETYYWEYYPSAGAGDYLIKMRYLNV